MAKALRIALSLFSASLLVLAARELWQADWPGAIRAAGRMDPASLGLAGLFIVISFGVIAGYDSLAWSWQGVSGIPFRAVLRVSFIATCAAMNIGVSALSGGAVRLKLYGEMGFELKTVAAVYARIVVLFAVGWLIWLGIGLGLAGRLLAAATGLPGALFALGGGGGVAGAGLYLAACARGWTLHTPKARLAAPSVRFAFAHLAVSAADILTTAVVFHLLVLPGAVPFLHSTALFMLANTAGMASQVPGGLGVFEWVALTLAAPSAESTARALGGLLVFRLAFFWIPLGLALPLALRSFRRPVPPADRADL